MAVRDHRSGGHDRAPPGPAGFVRQQHDDRPPGVPRHPQRGWPGGEHVGDTRRVRHVPGDAELGLPRRDEERQRAPDGRAVGGEPAGDAHLHDPRPQAGAVPQGGQHQRGGRLGQALSRGGRVQGRPRHHQARRHHPGRQPGDDDRRDGRGEHRRRRRRRREPATTRPRTTTTPTASRARTTTSASSSRTWPARRPRT